MFRYFYLFRLREKLCSSDFSFSQVTKVGKRELRKRFLRLRQRRSREMFPRFPFSYWGNLAKTQIRRGQILPKEVSSTNIETECFFHFSGFFVKFHSIEVIAMNSKIMVLWNANLQFCWGQGISQILQFNQWQSWNNDFIII